MAKEKILGLTTITVGYRIALLKNVRELLEKWSSEKIRPGTRLIYYMNEQGQIFIRPA
jgi:hypothetical protein